jgi:hypothetical protein
MKNTKAKLTGIRPAMVPFGLRIPVEQAKILHKAARERRCNGADLLRTAWDEYIVNHNLKGE